MLNPPSVTPLLAMHMMGVRLQPGATPGTNINCTDVGTTYWNREAVTDTTNLAKSGSGGSYSLNAGGTVLTIALTKEVVGISGMGVSIHDVNSSAPAENYTPGFAVTGGNITLSIYKESSIQDITTILDAGDLFDIWVSYVTAT